MEPAEKLLDKLLEQNNDKSFEFRLQLLESAASRLGHFSLEDYHNLFDIVPSKSYETLDRIGKEIVEVLSSLPVHPALLLSALAREPLPESVQRTAGAYYTDFRLAQHLVELSKPALKEGSKVLDPACGTGILLVAVSISVCGADRRKAGGWLANSVFAADLSPLALRGARLALASLTNDLDAIAAMWRNWRVQDSLLVPIETWKTMSSDLFDVVIGNPPWEKVKLTRHEYLSSEGADRHYGQEYGSLDTGDYSKKRKEVMTYAQALKQQYDLLGSGEPDLYMAFLALFSKLLKPQGRVAILVPAGLIRSQGTEALRRQLFRDGSDIRITIMENRARFFAIDTRFKFLSLSYTSSASSTPSKDPIYLQHAIGTSNGVSITGKAKISRRTLEEIRSDLTIPEVRSNREWDLFVSMVRNGLNWSQNESTWYPEFCREVDMTHFRSKFLKKPNTHSLPVIEGRMIQPYHFGAKRYISGSGRRAVWEPVPKGQHLLAPQFWIDPDELGEKAIERSRKLRVGFCDIAGQTNERSMMATLIPPFVVCGNKVPTILFPNDPSESRLHLCIGILNSIPFDWMLRRILTTTVNYFVLLGLPFPRIEPDDLPGRYIINAVRTLIAMNTAGVKYDPWKNAEMRAAIDVSVLVAYGLGYADLSLMLEDFPLLDRGQPAIMGERESTITKDYLMLCAAKRFGMPTESLLLRVETAKSIGAVPYVPSEMAVKLSSKREVILNDEKN